MFLNLCLVICWSGFYFRATVVLFYQGMLKYLNHLFSFFFSQVHDVKAPLPKPAILPPPNSCHRSMSPSSSSGLTPSPELRQSPLTPTPLTLEELRTQLRDLRASIEMLKHQHRWGCLLGLCLSVFLSWKWSKSNCYCDAFQAGNEAASQRFGWGEEDTC